jgi:hypothetical protein
VNRSGKLLKHTQTSQPEDVTAWCHTASASASADKVHPSVFDITVIASVSLVTQNRLEQNRAYTSVFNSGKYGLADKHTSHGHIANHC